MWDTISQIAVFVLGTSAIVLVAKKNKWGFVEYTNGFSRIKRNRPLARQF